MKEIVHGGSHDDPKYVGTTDSAFDGEKTIKLRINADEAEVLPGDHLRADSQRWDILAYDPGTTWEGFLRASALPDGSFRAPKATDGDHGKAFLDLVANTPKRGTRMARIYLSAFDSTVPLRIEHYSRGPDQRWVLRAVVRDMEFVSIPGDRLFSKRAMLQIYGGRNGYEPGAQPINVTTVHVRTLSTDNIADPSIFTIGIPEGFSVTDVIARVRYTKGFAHLTSGFLPEHLTGQWLLEQGP
jgi:hypothetical protein